jgi:hypothetical protein
MEEQMMVMMMLTIMILMVMMTMMMMMHLMMISNTTDAKFYQLPLEMTTNKIAAELAKRCHPHLFEN